MYGLPKNIDLTFLIGKEVIQVSIGFNDLILHFSEEVIITITSECSYMDDKKKLITFDMYPESASLVCRLLGCVTDKVQSEENGTLILGFSNGCTFKIHDDSNNYESYQIKHPLGVITV